MQSGFGEAPFKKQKFSAAPETPRTLKDYYLDIPICDSLYPHKVKTFTENLHLWRYDLHIRLYDTVRRSFTMTDEDPAGYVQMSVLYRDYLPAYPWDVSPYSTIGKYNFDSVTAKDQNLHHICYDKNWLFIGDSLYIYYSVDRPVVPGKYKLIGYVQLETSLT